MQRQLCSLLGSTQHARTSECVASPLQTAAIRLPASSFPSIASPRCSGHDDFWCIYPVPSRLQGGFHGRFMGEASQGSVLLAPSQSVAHAVMGVLPGEVRKKKALPYCRMFFQSPDMESQVARCMASQFPTVLSQVRLPGAIKSSQR